MPARTPFPAQLKKGEAFKRLKQLVSARSSFLYAVSSSQCEPTSRGFASACVSCLCAVGQIMTSSHLEAERLLRMLPASALLVIRALLLEHFGRHDEILRCEPGQLQALQSCTLAMRWSFRSSVMWSDQDLRGPAVQPTACRGLLRPCV